MNRRGRRPARSAPVTRDLAGVPSQDVRAILDAPPTLVLPAWVQSRIGEERHHVAPTEELRAIYSSPWFWEVAAELPRNDLSTQRLGRKADYPDWLLFLLDCAAGISGIGTRRHSVALFSDQRVWQDFAADVDRFVPAGWTKLSELRPSASKVLAHQRPRAGQRARTATVVPMQSSRPRQRMPRSISALPPRDHHLDYFALQWRGYRKHEGKTVPIDDSHPWSGVRQRIWAAFRKQAAAQARAMGLFDPSKPFGFKQPDPTQYAGFDGVVFPMTRRRPSKACEEHFTAGGSRRVYGSKYTIASCRILGSYGSRLILDLQHNGGAGSADPDESTATVAMAKCLAQETQRGMKGIVVDSVLRGKAVQDLERHWVTVVNYPHAASNPGAQRGQRRAAGSTEKSYLRRVLSHQDSNGVTCEHALYFVGGILVEKLLGDNGQPTIRRLDIDDYEQRGGATSRRQYFKVTLHCSLAGDFQARVPLFHLDSVSTDPAVNYGEVSRVFAPNSSNFNRLYGMRNDTESRHTNLKARARHLPADVPGQELRLLGAAVTSNSVAWQLHLQSAGMSNVFDDTA